MDADDVVQRGCGGGGSAWVQRRRFSLGAEAAVQRGCRGGGSAWIHKPPRGVGRRMRSNVDTEVDELICNSG